MCNTSLQLLQLILRLLLIAPEHTQQRKAGDSLYLQHLRILARGVGFLDTCEALLRIPYDCVRHCCGFLMSMQNMTSTGTTFNYSVNTLVLFFIFYRFQLQGSAASTTQYRSIAHCFTTMYRTEG